MKISGFTMVRNATRLYYPVKAAIESILPICDEFIVALGKGDDDDSTEQEIRSIGSEKIRIIHTVWDVERYTGGTVYAQQTDLAKNACSGDWLFYIQSDEVVHEKYLPVIRSRCMQLLDDGEIDGLLFNYRHFWGDYSHYIVSHAWYPKEIRIVRNRPDIHSWKDAQSFRKIPVFNGNYLQKDGTYKLQVADAGAEIFHYGWVRPPRLMQQKRKTFTGFYIGRRSAEKAFEKEGELFDYGDLNKLKVFNDTHPKVMEPWIKKFDWSELLRPDRSGIQKHKHDNVKYRLLTFIEQHFLKGELIGGFKNYKLINR